MIEPVIIPIFGIMLPLVLVPSIITLVHRHKRREWQHQERLRAIEMGLPVAPGRPWLGGAAVTAIAAGVPAASVLGAIVATLNIPLSQPDYLAIIAVIWVCASLISAVALLTGLILGVLLLRSKPHSLTVDQFPANTKPAFEPDAYDVVSSRGA